jgi:23S rRNA pseudouridine2605 synthase
MNPMNPEDVKADQTQSDADNGKQVKRGVRGPRNMRRTRAKSDVAAPVDATGSGGAEFGAATPDAGERPARTPNQNRQRKPRADRPDGGQSSSRAERPPREAGSAGVRGNGRRPQQAKGGRRDAATPDDVFSFVTSEAFDADVTEDDKSKGRGATLSLCVAT